MRQYRDDDHREDALQFRSTRWSSTFFGRVSDSQIQYVEVENVEYLWYQWFDFLKYSRNWAEKIQSWFWFSIVHFWEKLDSLGLILSWNSWGLFFVLFQGSTNHLRPISHQGSCVWGALYWFSNKIHFYLRHLSIVKMLYSVKVETILYFLIRLTSVWY